MESHNGDNDVRESKAHIRKWGRAPRAHYPNRRISTNSEEYSHPMLHELVTRAAASFGRSNCRLFLISALRNSLEVSSSHCYEVKGGEVWAVWETAEAETTPGNARDGAKRPSASRWQSQESKRQRNNTCLAIGASVRHLRALLQILRVPKKDPKLKGPPGRAAIN